MSKKFLGKVIAGAALGGASLLVCAPSSALADGPHYPEEYHNGDRGRILSKPHVAKPGEEIKLIEICPKQQEHAWLWSKVTGKVDLAPAEHRKDWTPREHGEGKKTDERGYGDDAATNDEKRAGKDSKGGWESGKQSEDAKDEHAKQETKPSTEGWDSDARSEKTTEKYQEDADYQEFLRYKEYLEYRRYKEKEAPTHGDPGAADSASGNEKRSDSSAAVPAPSPSPSPSPDASRANNYGEPAERSAAGTGGMADHGAGPEGYTDGWSHDDKTEEHRKSWDKDAKADDHRKDWDKDAKADEFAYWTTVTIPADAKPGHYELTGSCADGELIVLPKGWVDGGDGGATSGSSDNLAVGGVGMLGVAALGGLVLMRRHRTDETHA